MDARFFIINANAVGVSGNFIRFQKKLRDFAMKKGCAIDRGR
jgi:hypothetical protein